MTSERELAIFMAHILDQTNRHQDMINYLKRAISFNPVLTSDERNLLASAYKEAVSVHRNGLRILSAIGVHDEGLSRGPQIDEIRGRILSDLEAICKDAINLITEQLLSVAPDSSSRIFFEKLLADYYRYICEARGEHSGEMADSARRGYLDALEIAKDSLKPASPANLGLVLNYSVFLFEVLNDAHEAIDLVSKIYSDCSVLIEDNSEDSYSEATRILQVLRDNLGQWNASVRSE
jgi:14-3-3 protein epsilon